MALFGTMAHPDLSLVLQRIHLPEEEENICLPQGKPQLTEEEINILYFFIKDGASFTKKVTDLPTADTLRILANKIFRKPFGRAVPILQQQMKTGAAIE